MKASINLTNYRFEVYHNLSVYRETVPADSEEEARKILEKRYPNADLIDRI